MVDESEQVKTAKTPEPVGVPVPDPRVPEGALSPGQKRRIPPKMRSARVALAHDWLVSARGGEFVLDRFAALVKERYASAGIYTLFANKKPILAHINEHERITSRLNLIPGAKGKLRRWLLPLYPGAVEALGEKLEKAHKKNKIDLLLSTSSGLIKGLAAPEGVPHLCYCHAPARYLWSITGEYTGGGSGGAMRGIGFKLFGEKLRNWDRTTATNVTRFLANSTHTAREIERCFSRDSEVLYPPVRTRYFTPDPNVQREEFWLVVTALEPYKRTELAIEAAMLEGKKLMIAGTGTRQAALRRFAIKTGRRLKKAGIGKGRHKLVNFLGRVDDETLRKLYRRARLLVFPQIEDFGIVAVEAQACGCPVVARRAGGALDTVLEGRSGCFFNEPTAETLRQAAKRCPTGVSDQCRASAARFSEGTFDRAAERIVRQTLSM